MYTMPRSNYLRRSLLTGPARSFSTTVDPADHKRRVENELRELGSTRRGLWRLSSRYLPHIIHPDERLGGVIYGRCDEGSVMLVATDKRVIFLDKKPLFINTDEITYDVVSGITSSRVGLVSTVVLHTRVRDYRIRTFNHDCARQFVAFIESRCLEHQYNAGQNFIFTPTPRYRD